MAQDPCAVLSFMPSEQLSLISSTASSQQLVFTLELEHSHRLYFLPAII